MTSGIPVNNLLHEELLTCPPDELLQHAAALMRAARCSSILVVDGDAAVGIWTERDILKVDFDDPASERTPIAQVMTSPVQTIDKEMSIDQVGKRFLDEGIRHLLVLDHRGGFAGIVSQTDIVLNYGIERYLKLRQIGSALRQPPLFLPEATTLAEACRRLRDTDAEAAIVVDAGGAAVGILTERDLVGEIADARTGRTVGDAASRPLISVDRSFSLLQARDLSVRKGIRHLGVTKNGKVTGVLSFATILRILEHDQVAELERILLQREEDLHASQRSLRLAQRIIDASLDGIIITDAEGTIESVNPAFSTLTGYSAEEVVGKRAAILQSGRHGHDFYATMWQSLKADGRWQGEIWNRRKDSSIYPEWLTITQILDEEGGGHHYVGIFNDISDRKQSEEQIRSMAYFDPLTGLPNRRMFNDRMSVAIPQMRRNGRKLAVQFIDLDLFKLVNDTLGHSVGDKVLQEMAARIKQCIRDGDTVSRIGGDEFTIIQPDLYDVEDSLLLAQRVTEAIRRPFQIDGHELDMTSSIGISIFPDDGESAEVLIKNADTAMYRAKELGRNDFQLYNESMNAESFEKLNLETQLRQAIARDQLQLNYQLKTDLESGHITGVEALLRWHHPEFGLVAPADFIPMAERSGMMVEIGEWVLHTAARQGRQWIDKGLAELSVAVNFSPQQMHQKDIVERVAAILAETGLPPEHLVIELTEGILMEQIEEVAPKLQRLRELGIRISVDDFGTGLSSLAHLKRLPIDSLKIDLSFIRDIPDNPDACKIVDAIIAMSQQFGLKVIAEGVERQEQANYLSERGCNEMQGYLINRPLSADNIARMLDQRLLTE